MHLSLKLTAVATLAALGCIGTSAMAQEQVVKIGHV